VIDIEEFLVEFQIQELFKPSLLLTLLLEDFFMSSDFTFLHRNSNTF